MKLAHALHALQVNVDFGSIFSTLLPGTTAKLEPQEGCSFMEGGLGVGDWGVCTVRILHAEDRQAA